ncbi:het-domain-containing protein [Fusarium heterosporum]|uniref:Het-domain-containing protein n=1 Tax=Fusarium heterosporum TaxID=42747 RepID=A0A8H5WT88_FUSHE|nr:het-domain-containing protein [Fusarium heterosporum]
MARDSKIIHQTPKVNWRNFEDDFEDSFDDDFGGDFEGDSQGPSPDLPKFEVFDHHSTLGALKRSARDCHLCALLSAYDHEYLEMDKDSSNDTTYVMKVIRADLHSDGPGVLKVQIRGARHTGATYLMDCEPKAKPLGTLRHDRTDHHEILELAKEWLNSCLTIHEACNTWSHPTGNGFLPTRLIKVSGLGTTVFLTKLCLGKDLPLGTRYLTLSHCWGGADIVKLTKDSLSSFLSDIPLQRLPQNFRDAATIALFLGCDYIWIDSLCIIQDSAEDWKHEAAAMGNVYRYSLCTIAALGAKDPYGGCFVNRRALSFTPCQLFPDSATRTGVYAENWRSRAPDWNKGSGSETLLTRGWVVQESALSPRTLYFGSEMVYWGCATCTASEADPKLPTSTSIQNTNVKQHLYDLLNKSENGDYYTFAQTWWNIITGYTSCNLTFASDRWPAISGLATIVESKSSSRLVHGLWAMNLPFELLWKVFNPRRDRRLEGDTPSWSWLSIDEPVHKMWYNMKVHFQMDPALSLQTHTGDDTKLFLRGRMVRLKWTTRYFGDGRQDYRFRFVDPAGSDADPWHGTWNPDLLPDSGWETWAVRFVVDDKVMEGAGLVLRRAEGFEEDIWTRVGAYSVQLGPLPNGRSIWELGKIQTITLT